MRKGTRKREEVSRGVKALVEVLLLFILDFLARSWLVSSSYSIKLARKLI